MIFNFYIFLFLIIHLLLLKTLYAFSNFFAVGYKNAQLLKIQIPILNTDYCRKIYKGRSPITNMQLCAGGFLGRDSCAGDSGGPLMIATADANGVSRFIQHGIVSFGPRQCGTKGQPGIYTKVSSYMEWILENIEAWDDESR